MGTHQTQLCKTSQSPKITNKSSLEFRSTVLQSGSTMSDFSINLTVKFRLILIFIFTQEHSISSL